MNLKVEQRIDRNHKKGSDHREDDPTLHSKRRGDRIRTYDSLVPNQVR